MSILLCNSNPEDDQDDDDDDHHVYPGTSGWNPNQTKSLKKLKLVWCGVTWLLRKVSSVNLISVNMCV